MARQYSENEKALIASIYDAKDSNNYVLTNVFNPWLYEMQGISFNLQKGTCLFDMAVYNHDVDTMLNIKKNIIGTALLIKHLEDSGYIYIIQDRTSTNPPIYIGASIKTPVEVDFPMDIAWIIKRSLYNIYVSSALISFVENGFRTYEDLQLNQASDNLTQAKKQLEESKKQTKYARYTLYTAIATIIISAIAPFMVSFLTGEDTYKNDLQNTLNQTYNILENSTENILTSIDSLNATGNHFKLQNEDVIQNLKRQERLLKTMNNRIKKIQEQTNNSQMTNTNPEL